MDCAAAEGLYGLAEGAFGADAGGNPPDADGQSGGQCPNVNPLSDAECAGAVSTCWSPGQPDTDCPNFGLCCFDGCANTCDGPQGNNRASHRPSRRRDFFGLPLGSLFHAIFMRKLSNYGQVLTCFLIYFWRKNFATCTAAAHSANSP